MKKLALPTPLGPFAEQLFLSAGHNGGEKQMDSCSTGTYTSGKQNVY